MVSRFREELAEGRSPLEAAQVTRRTAGRTTAFAGSTLVLSMAVAFFIVPGALLASMAATLIMVVVLSVADLHHRGAGGAGAAGAERRPLADRAAAERRPLAADALRERRAAPPGTGGDRDRRRRPAARRAGAGAEDGPAQPRPAARRRPGAPGLRTDHPRRRQRLRSAVPDRRRGRLGDDDRSEAAGGALALAAADRRACRGWKPWSARRRSSARCARCTGSGTSCSPKKGRWRSWARWAAASGARPGASARCARASPKPPTAPACWPTARAGPPKAPA